MEWGQDTESGVWGLGYSPDNGKNFYVLNTTHGRKYRAEDGNRLYPYISDQIQDKIDTVVAPAKSAADSAYSMASQAVEQAEVTKQAQAETAEALNEAKVGANEAASRAVSAMDEAKRIGTLLDDNQKDIDEQNKSLEDLRGQVTSLNSASTKITSDVSQARTDLATEKARLDQVAEQAATNSTNIATYKATNDGLSAQLATTQGDVADLQANATKLQSSMTNAQSDISLLKQTASGIQTDVANTKSDISQIDQKADSIKSTVSGLSTDVTGFKSSTSQLTTQLAQTNSSVSITAQKADNAVSTANSANDKASAAASDVAQIKVTADGVTTIAKNAQSDATLAEQTATEAKTTATNASGDATVAKQTASEAKTTATNAQSGVSILQQTASNISSRVSSVENSVKTQIISSAIDLNTLTTRGLYSIQTTSQTNSPASNWAMVSVQGNADDGTRLYQSWWADADSTKIYYRSRLGGTWTAWSTKADTSDITALQAKITSNSTAIDQNKKSIALKADQTTVDTLKGTVSQNTATLTTQADEIKNKVTRSDVTGMLTGYATQDYTQSLVTQKADEWNVNLTKLKNDTQTSLTQLAVGVEGVQAQVYNSDGSSKITQLSNLIATKVSQDDYNSQITQLKNDINLRVAKGDVISQINQEAGGDTLIQVSNGKKSLILDAGNTIITGKAWIPDAAISSISADKIMLGSSALYNSDGTLNLVNQSNDLKALIQVKQGLVQDTTQSIISFSSDYNNRAFSVTPVGATVTPTLFFERYDQTAGHWLGFTRNEVRRDGLMFNTWDNDGERFFVACHARFDRNISATGNIYQGSWNGTTGKPLAGVLSIQSGNTIWSGSDFLAIGDHLSNSFTNVMARSFSQQSTLSSKTNIETVDPKDALDLVNRTDIRSYQYKTDVAEGKAKRYTSLIIDDVNDVSKYYAPDEFTNEERTGRDDGSAVGYLFLAIQELTRRIKTLEEKLNG
ncbi:tail fiber domain-containing protein [Limosilactobacillus fermentum]|uniref:Tail fiber n=1 Tax=Lactobacillus phage LF1 TaxID=947980 RepID=E9LUJ5_9CAUD|nr:virion structural protein [Lactobacillus phage LF1]ADW01241.1 tail fiber [Lactobacillus phage LF1]